VIPREFTAEHGKARPNTFLVCKRATSRHKIPPSSFAAIKMTLKKRRAASSIVL